MIWLDPGFDKKIQPRWETVKDALAIRGETYRQPENAQRRTLRFEVDGRGYFIKQHWGVGWGEILKNLLTLKRPVLGAENEWLAINRLNQLGIETMELMGFGIEGWNPAQIRSFVVTRELADTISLEDYCANWATSAADPVIKRLLISRVADMVSKLHANGVNHRDLYICHFLLQLPWQGDVENLSLYLIDLHRVQIRSRTPRSWLIRDLGALYFSALNIGLTRRDLLRFIRNYQQQPLAESLVKNARFWRAVKARAEQLSRRKLKA